AQLALDGNKHPWREWRQNPPASQRGVCYRQAKGKIVVRRSPMSQRFFASMVVVASIVNSAAAQATHKKSPASKAWTAPLTSDGQPDLQGVWLDNSATPLERPKALEGRPFLTDAEVAELKQRADRLFKRGDSDFAAGDNAFLAALANVDVYKNPNATGGTEG